MWKLWPSIHQGNHHHSLDNEHNCHSPVFPDALLKSALSPLMCPVTRQLLMCFWFQFSFHIPIFYIPGIIQYILFNWYVSVSTPLYLFLNSSMSVCVSLVYSFFLLSSIPLYWYATKYLFINLLMYIYLGVSNLRLL